MATKINLEKAYDMVEWNLVRETLMYIDLPNNFISEISMQYASFTE